jgi:predicted alpha/beta-fold hydrolase
VINHRGTGVTITSARTYGGCSYDDYEEALIHIKKKHPDLNLFGVGFSLGGVIVGNYVGKAMENSLLSAAVCIC